MRNLMQSGFLQRDRNGAFLFLQGTQRAFGSDEITAEQEENRRCLGDRAPHLAMETAACAGRIGVEVCWLMRLRRFPRAIGEMLFRIASARIENSQTKWRRVILRHRKCRVSDEVGYREGDSPRAAISKSPTQPKRRFVNC